MQVPHFKLTQKRVYFLYFAAIFLLYIVGISIPFKIWGFNFWTVLAAVLYIIVPLALLAGTDEILDAILPTEVKDEIGFYITTYHSKGFEQFAGSEILTLMNDSSKLALNGTIEGVTDYSYMVLPLAKAYEGVLKKILVSINLVEEKKLKDNPNITVNSYFNPQNNLKIVEQLKDKARHKTLPYVIFATYQDCRNQICHYDPYSNNSISHENATYYRQRLLDAIYRSYETFIQK